jgi:hypothetical protein
VAVEDILVSYQMKKLITSEVMAAVEGHTRFLSNEEVNYP